MLQGSLCRDAFATIAEGRQCNDECNMFFLSPVVNL